MVLYPNGLDDFNNPTGQSHMNDAPVLHSVQHSEVNDALEAMQRKMGINNSPVATSFDYRIRKTEDQLVSITTSSIPYGSLTAWDEFLTVGSFPDGTDTQSGQDWHVSSSDFSVVSKNKLHLTTGTNGYLWIEDIGPVGQLTLEFSFAAGSTENAAVITTFSNQVAPVDPSLKGIRFKFTPTSWSVAVWNNPSFPASFASGSYADIQTDEVIRVVIRRISVQYIGITLPDGSMVKVFEPSSGNFDTFWQGTVLVGAEQPSGTFVTDRLPTIHSYAAGGVWNMESGAQGPGVPDGGSTGQFLVKLSNANQDSGWVFPAGISVANDSIWTAVGQLVYATGTGHSVTLNIGTANQVLTVNGSANGFSYVSTKTSTFISDFTEAAQDAVGGMFAGDVQSGITVAYQDGTNKVDFTVNDSPLLQSQNGAYYLARANHTGTQLSTTVSDFAEAVDDRVNALLLQGTGITLTYNDPANTLTIAGYGGIITDSTWVAAGDLLQGTGSSTAARLARGGATNYLRVNAAGTALEWSDFNEDVGDNIELYVTGNTESGITVSYDDSVNKLNFTVTDSPLLQGQNGAYYLSRANHTGTIISTVVSDFTEAAQDAVGTILTDTATIDFTYNDASNLITADVIDNSITNTKLSDMAQSTIRGRAAAGGTGDPQDLTVAQVKTILALSTSDISGLGTIATQNSNNVTITGGSITGITDLVVADGGTGASTFTAGYLKASGTSAFTTVAVASVVADIGAATSTHSHVSNINYETHTYALLGDGGTTTIFTPHVVAKQAAETLQLIRVTYRVSTGTPTVKLRNNGTDITGFTGLSVTSTKASTTPTAVTLADLDELDIVCTAGSWTVFLYLTMTFARTKTITSP